MEHKTRPGLTSSTDYCPFNFQNLLQIYRLSLMQTTQTESPASLEIL